MFLKEFALRGDIPLRANSLIFINTNLINNILLLKK
jgi:hypothetical protein